MHIKPLRSAIIIQVLAVFPAIWGTAQEHDQSSGISPQDYFTRNTEMEWLGSASAAVFAVKVSGDTVACSGSRKMLIPASTLKTVTTGLALHSLGPDYRFETGIGYTGTISDGVLRGDLYILGGGDPVLGSRNRIAEPVENVFGAWLGMLSEAGIVRIDGNIIGDDRFFDRIAEIDSWQWNDIGTYYGTGVCGLSFNENMQNINVTPGDAPGRPLTVKTGYPELPWMNYRFSCTTGKPGTGNTLYLFTSSFAPEGEMRGTYAIDRKTRTEQVSNKFPAYTCAWHFRKYLSECGVECTGKAADLGPVFGIEGHMAPQDGITAIGKTFSPELSAIAGETNHESNNLYAETLFKTLGKEYCGKGDYDSAREAVGSLLEEIGVCPSDGSHIVDGSGLSRLNGISPEFMCGFLKAMMDSPAFGTYVESLPQPGGPGTLLYNMREYPSAVKARIRMKSGSMTGVKCYCGYIIPTEGSRDDTIVFSIMVNNYFGPSSRLQKFLDRMIYLMAERN